ncbi:MAG: GDP-mannose 4,6-dehydratase [Firmicutes bacterium]|nr:GDP-mannose 4,6-dehydratase [Bacillota bacterium]
MSAQCYNQALGECPDDPDVLFHAGMFLFNHLVELLGGEVTYIPRRPGEPDCTYADISKIKKCLGWEPKVSFEQGVAIVLKNIDYWREAPVWTPETIAEATRDWFRYLGPGH